MASIIEDALRRPTAGHIRSKMQIPTFCMHTHLEKHQKLFEHGVGNLRAWYPKPLKSTHGGSQRPSQEQASKNRVNMFRPWDRFWGTYLSMFFGFPPGEGFQGFVSPGGLQNGRLWGVMFETLAENLENVIFEDLFMLLAGLGTQN